VTKLKQDHGEEYDIKGKLKIAIVTAMCPSTMIEAVYSKIKLGISYVDFLKEVKVTAENKMAVQGMN